MWKNKDEVDESKNQNKHMNLSLFNTLTIKNRKPKKT